MMKASVLDMPKVKSLWSEKEAGMASTKTLVLIL